MSFDFITIDFETANSNLNSACSIGLAAVKDNKIIETQYFLIKPPRNHFNKNNIAIHGITPEDVVNSLSFFDVWQQIRHYFEQSYIVIAHNAVFDMSVLKKCFIEYSIDEPEFYYLCSIPLSTKACANTGVGRSLKDRTSYFGIELVDHHNAVADAEACAKLVIKCLQYKNCDSILTYIENHPNLPIKLFSELNPIHSMNKSYSKFNRIPISEIKPTTINFDESHIFYGKNIVFTGELKSFDRKEAMQKVINLGGIIKSSVSRKTNFLIVGLQDKSIVGADGMSTKEEKAYQLIANGIDIKIVNEDEFTNYVG